MSATASISISLGKELYVSLLRNFIQYHNKSIYGIKISCINEGSPKGTAGSILKAKSQLDDFFFLCNGDTYFDINILDLINYLKKNYLMSLALDLLLH